MLPLCVLITLLLFSTDLALSKTIIKSLPGYTGNLPFLLETGYIGVGKEEEVQLFYYFIESERSPEEDPLVLWLTGGPGCSAFSGLVYEIGPLKYDYANCTGNKPVFTINPYSWTKVASIIFVDSPVGTGFSYATTWQAYNVGDTIAASQLYEFLIKWLEDHPKFLTNPLYIAGDSYSGIIVPIVVLEISNGNEREYRPSLNLKGYVIGNPLTDSKIDFNSRVPLAYRTGLISDKQYMSFVTNCGGEYLYPDPSNVLCLEDIQTINNSIARINLAQILEPTCKEVSPKTVLGSQWDRNAVMDDPIPLRLSALRSPEPWCRTHHYAYIYIWANDKTVQEALHIRKGSKEYWTRCNKSLSYVYDVPSTVGYHLNLTTKSLRSLVYSGDHDLVVPHVGTMRWIESLNMTIDKEWEAWLVDDQVGGYTMRYVHDKYQLTFATVKGGGHTAPEYKPKQSLAMIERWFDYSPL